MIITCKDDQKIISHLRRAGLYHKLMAPIPNDFGYPVRIFRKSGDIFLHFSGHSDPAQNGYLWLRLVNPTRQEIYQVARLLGGLAVTSCGVMYDTLQS